MFSKCPLIAALVIMTTTGFSQQGLFLSTQNRNTYSRKPATPQAAVQTIHKFSFNAWTQPVGDKNSFGLSYMLNEYLPANLTIVRAFAGVHVSDDRLHSIADFNNFLIKPNSPGWEVGTGFTKLFPQPGNYNFEFAINADLYAAQRYQTIDHIRTKLTTYHSRMGIEFIPFPGKLSFYGNVNFIIGTSGTKAFLQKLSVAEDVDPRPLLEKAEYFDVGIKYQLRLNRFIITPDINLILAERRIVTKSTEQDWIVPNINLDVAWMIGGRTRK